jgi:hypothetical protein
LRTLVAALAALMVFASSGCITNAVHEASVSASSDKDTQNVIQMVTFPFTIVLDVALSPIEVPIILKTQSFVPGL